jgi:phosphate-selective porin
MVESYINVKILKEQLQVRTGKFIVPFSTENLRSSRGYDVVERYLALNSMFLLPGLDTQYGLMVWGEFEETPLSYWAGVFNGNGSANTNVKENNVAKEITGKLQYSFTPQFKVSAAFDYSNENTQTLKLSDYTFTDYHAVSVRGDRLGYNADLYYEHGPWSFRTEGLIFDFPDSGYQLFGGFLQPAYFFYGNYQKGLQALIRLDIAGLKNSADNSVKRLSAYTLGFQWFFSPNLRLQADYHITSVNTPGSLSVYTNSGELLHSLLASLQLKF